MDLDMPGLELDFIHGENENIDYTVLVFSFTITL
jgi:hypothetical protein